MRRLSSQRGSAMVEFSILMLVLIPLILYSHFLGSVAFHRLELQEAVISSVWDFSQRNEEPHNGRTADSKADADAVGAFERVLYGDHTSAYDDPSDFYSNNEEHHVEFGVHACWLGNGSKGSAYDAPGSTEITCTVDPTADLDWMQVLSGKKFANSDLNRGGLGTCWGKEWVYNYLIPETFMPEHSHAKLNGGKTMWGNQNDGSGLKGKASTTGSGVSSVHGIEGSGGTAANIFIKDRAAISYGTWALMNGAPGSSGWKLNDADLPGSSDSDIINSSNPFYQRVKFVWEKDDATELTYLAVYGAYGLYVSEALAKEDELIPVLATPGSDPSKGLGIVDFTNVVAPYLVARYKAGQPYSSVTRWSNKLESTPYTSYDGDNYVSAYSSRGPYYLGNQSQNE